MIHKSKQGRANINFYNCDNITFMKSKPDNFYKLAIVDPEYGIGASNMQMGSGKNKKYVKKDWDNKRPTREYFTELFRVSENQIICGGNYFTDVLPITKSWILWDKGIYGDCTFADGEMIWTSFDKVLRIAQIRYKGFLGADKQRIHITQKPIKLYKWLLTNYAKQGDNIYDSHGGSCSIAIAAIDLEFDIDICELDEDYYQAAKQRIITHSKQLDLFREQPILFFDK